MSRQKIDYIGWKNEMLEVVGFDTEKQLWKCKCECGNLIFYSSRQLQNNKPKSCGCLRSKNLVGQTFGRLKVRERTDKRDDNYNTYYLCECNCKEHDKNTKLVTATDLLKGNVKSCGCMATECNKELGSKLALKTKEKCLEGTNIRNLTMKTPKSNTSGIKGVTWDKSRCKWLAQIRFKGKLYYLGRYDTKEEAGNVRKIAEDKLFGEFLEWYENEYGKTTEP